MRSCGLQRLWLGRANSTASFCMPGSVLACGRGFGWCQWFACRQVSNRSARTRSNARRRMSAQRHVGGNRRITCLPVRTSRAAVCSNRLRMRFGSHRAAAPSRQRCRNHDIRSCPMRTNSNQTALAEKAWKGRLRIPLSLPLRMLFSTRAWPRCRASKYAMS